MLISKVTSENVVKVKKWWLQQFLNFRYVFALSIVSVNAFHTGQASADEKVKNVTKFCNKCQNG